MEESQWEKEMIRNAGLQKTGKYERWKKQRQKGNAKVIKAVKRTLMNGSAWRTEKKYVGSCEDMFVSIFGVAQWMR